MIMFRTLSPRAAADFARFMRENTGGMDGNWPHLMMIGNPGYFAALVKWHQAVDQSRPR